MTRWVRSTATTSWIDERLYSLTLPEVDSNSQEIYTNNTTISREVILDEESYRFANFLEAYVEVQDGRISSHGFTPESRLYRSASFFGIESEVFASQQSVQSASDSITFTQLVGCRTRSPEVIAEYVGGGVGALLGLYLGGILFSPGGALAGSRTGREVVEELAVFPPIWTELSLTIRTDGTSDQHLLRSSIFPSHCFYSMHIDNDQIYNRISLYDARLQIEAWQQGGWGSGNPWQVPNPSGWGDNRDEHANLPSDPNRGATNYFGPTRGPSATYIGPIRGGARQRGSVGA